jgi:hypothetical protein
MKVTMVSFGGVSKKCFEQGMLIGVWSYLVGKNRATAIWVAAKDCTVIATK